MAEKGKITLRIMTPGRVVTQREVDFVVLRTVEGEMGFLPGHEACVAVLDYGVIRSYIDKRPVDVLAALGGFARMRDNELNVLTTVAEPPDQIDAALEAVAKQREANKLHELNSDLEIRRAENALRRTLVQMDVSAYSILKGNTGEEIGPDEDEAHEE